MDGCTLWFDGDWRQCCDAHDRAYLDGDVTLQSHVDLGLCVAQTSGGPVMGVVMAIACIGWWIIRHRGRRRLR